MTRLGWLLLFSACYRSDTTTTPPRPDPLVQATTCNADDDVARPVLDSHDGRLRMHSTAPLTAVRGRAGGRAWIGPAVPAYVPKRIGTLELMVLDEIAGEGYLALYRDPYDVASCRLGNESNCAYQARYFSGGKVAWSLPLNKLMSRTDHLEIQDIRLSGGVLYFNEACQSYSNEAGGDCSSLVAVDPAAGRVLWRSPVLTSNNRFMVRGCYIVAGYGFTSEPDALHLIDRGTGKIVQRLPVASAPQGYTFADPARLDVTLYSGDVRRYRLDNALA
ncbi:MAG: hypothetical protein H0V17_18440, partial [Deltaproteobacteria bacterium]|nr:hypothetical protein [Deltaproteobacteria bacterium]